MNNNIVINQFKSSVRQIKFSWKYRKGIKDFILYSLLEIDFFFYIAFNVKTKFCPQFLVKILT
jgi:hypothetical protein